MGEAWRNTNVFSSPRKQTNKQKDSSKLLPSESNNNTKKNITAANRAGC